MYAVYRRLNGRYDLVANFKTLGEASAHADALRRYPPSGMRCWYYVTGRGLPVPAGLVLPPVRPVLPALHCHPAPARGIFSWLGRLFRRAAPATLPSQPPTDVVQPPPHRTSPAPTATRHDRSLGQRTFGRPADDQRVWADEDRWDDIALAHRNEEELGLGIPAQWGKGRRNR